MLSPIVSLSALGNAVRRFSSNRRASTAVEFALVAPMFFALIFAILETALYFFAGQILEIGTQDTARLIFTNQPPSQADFKTNLCNRVVVLMTCTNVYVSVKSYPQGTVIPQADLADPIDAGGHFVDPTVYQSSAPGYTVLVRAFYQWPLFVTGLGYNIANIGSGTSSSRLLTATAAFRVEPGP
jgi:Flp pilus assembly protein TadG